MNTPKWIPKHSNEVLRLFEDSRCLIRDFRVLGKKYSTDVNLSLPDYFELGELLNQSKKCFDLSEQLQMNLAKLTATSVNPKIERSVYKVLQSKKAQLCRQNMKRRHLQLIFIIKKMIKGMLESTLNSNEIIDGALVLCALHNGSVAKTAKNCQKSISGAQVCSNSFPTLLLPQKCFDVGMVLQALSKQRSELCCMSLITCLLETCKPAEVNANADSDTSSVEILRALTSHLASPLGKKNHSTADYAHPLTTAGDEHRRPLDSHLAAIGNMTKDLIVGHHMEQADSKISDKPTIEKSKSVSSSMASGTELLEELIATEEIYIANIILKCCKLCPNAFATKPTKAEVMKLVTRGSRGLWTQVGSTLEHVVLWWSSAPLACRPSACAKYLRDWLLIIQPDDAPEPILSTLKGLGETLTVHVTSTSWDKQFRLTLVASGLPVSQHFERTAEFFCPPEQLDGTTTGRLWSELLYSLTSFSNSCDRGTIPNELPIVEQIPVLHRMDHSIHTLRLWAAAQAKSLCTDWNMKLFFRVVHTDVTHCLEQLKELRVPEMVPTDSLEVLTQVCVALRAKLVSEIRVNISKLAQTYAECIDVLGIICRTISLATLSLCFPAAHLWQTGDLQEMPNDYVKYFLDQLYQPIIQATNMLEILSLVLKILCEAWLDHIYMKKIKFSRIGAMNLLKDFDGIADWIGKNVPTDHVETLGRHEVLRMCEGVAKILLRKPDEVISMVAKGPATYHQKAANDTSFGGNDEKALLPPEMFVPNQQRWLELRARNRTSLYCLCASSSTPDTTL